MTGRSDTTVRLVLLGAARVGKSALIRRLLHERFDSTYTRTVEELHVLQCGALRVEVLDTSGSYAFPAMRELCIRHSDAFALVYAVDDAGSFEAVRRLRDEILRLRGDRSAPITVVGSKAELTEAEGRALPAARVMATVEGEWGANFVEASARTGRNAVDVFRAMLQQVDVRHRLSPAPVKRRAPVKKSNSCILS